MYMTKTSGMITIIANPFPMSLPRAVFIKNERKKAAITVPVQVAIKKIMMKIPIIMKI